MAFAWMDDRWLRKADDGSELGKTLRRKLDKASNPMMVDVPAKYRTAKYGVGKRWRVVWRVPGDDGIAVQKSKSFSSYRDAEEYMSAMEDDLRRGRYRRPEDAKRTVGEVARLWFASKVNIRSSTLNRYRRDWAHYVEPRWADMPLSSVQPVAVQAWVEQLRNGTAPTTVGMRVALSPNSIRAIVRVVLGGVMGYAVKQGWADSNPVDAVSLPRITSKSDDMHLLTIGEVERLAQAAENVGKRDDSRHWENGAIIRWQAYVGTRIGEALALRVGDVDFERRRARVRETWSDGDDEPVLALPKNGHERTVAWPEALEPALRRLCSERGRDRFLFAAPRGGAWSVRNWRNRVWAPALKASGLEPHVTIHDLRHTYASLAIRAGADVKTLQAQLGHSSAAMTLDVYAALWPEQLGVVADAVDAAIKAEALTASDGSYNLEA